MYGCLFDFKLFLMIYFIFSLNYNNSIVKLNYIPMILYFKKINRLMIKNISELFYLHSKLIIYSIIN